VIDTVGQTIAHSVETILSGLPNVKRKEMAPIKLLVLERTDWKQVRADPAAFARKRGLSVGAAEDRLRGVAEQTLALFERTGVSAEPWSGYLAENDAKVIVGTCGFKAPPDNEGVVEIAYFTFSGFEGNGYASAMAIGLVDRARGEAGVRRLRAHTLPERNASTRILEKAGFALAGEVVDPEDGPVWRWERLPPD
jgi:RimJ/RimL family protein N-acetyltransferase